MPFCTKCGTKLDGVQKFCHTCGTPVPKSDAASTPATEKKSLSALLSGASTKKVATSPTSIEKGNCKACGKPITGAVICALGSHWHKECFACKICHMKIFSFAKFAEEDGYPICLKCAGAKIPTCVGCKKQITDEHVEICGKHFHDDCLICANCGKKATRDFYEDNGKIYHLVCE